MLLCTPDKLRSSVVAYQEIMIEEVDVNKS
jgi:hypothetical protein